MSNLKSVFDRYCQTVKIDKPFITRAERLFYGVVNRDEDSIAFFGDALWGVYPIYFLNTDSNHWFDEVLDIDDIGLKKEVHALPTIETQYKVSSDIVNLSLLYVTHRSLTTARLSGADQKRLSHICLALLHVKFLSSLQAHRFRYRVDKSIAMAAYASLSKRYDLKVYGSWAALLEARSKAITDERALHRKALMRFENDGDVVYMVNDIQSRIRDLANKLTEEFYRQHEEEKRIGLSSKLISSEEGVRIRDTFNVYSQYREYLATVSADRNSLKRPELMSIVMRSMGRLSEEGLAQALGWIADNSSGKEQKQVSHFQDLVLAHAFRLMDEQQLKTNQIALIISRLRTVYLASRSKDERLLEAKKMGLKIVEMAVTSRNANIHVSLRSALMLYLVLRTLARNFLS